MTDEDSDPKNPSLDPEDLPPADGSVSMKGNSSDKESSDK